MSEPLRSLNAADLLADLTGAPVGRSGGCSPSPICI